MKYSDAGFTLVELSVAMLVTTIVMGMAAIALLWTFSSSAGIQSSSQQTASSTIVERAVVPFLRTATGISAATSTGVTFTSAVGYNTSTATSSTETFDVSLSGSTLTVAVTPAGGSTVTSTYANVTTPANGSPFTFYADSPSGGLTALSTPVTGASLASIAAVQMNLAFDPPTPFKADVLTNTLDSTIYLGGLSNG